jgi:coenzyme F420 hydrogenase subunit beta
MKTRQNVSHVVKSGLCISCGVCAVACPCEAIEMNYNDSHGMFFPTVDNSKCSGCGFCLDCCYGFKVDHELNLRVFRNLPNSIVGNYISSYVGFAKNHKLRFSSTSGGVATAVLIHALEEKLIDGAIVTGMGTGKMPKATPFIATTPEEIISTTTSKYCPVSLAECLKAVESGKRYAVVGLPCHIYGIRKLAEVSSKIRSAIRLYLGIVCGGMPSYLGTQYLFRIYAVKNHYVQRLEYRGGGWPGRLLIQSEVSNQQKISVPYPDYWQGAFQYFQPYRCTICHDGFNEFSDISCGDAWLPNIIRTSNEGTSLILTRTEIGENLIQEAFKKGRIQIRPITNQEVILSQRGLVQSKNIALRARVNLSKTIRKTLPTFDLSRTPPVKFSDYLLALDLYLGNAMALRKGLWWLFDMYLSFKKTVSRIVRL